MKHIIYPFFCLMLIFGSCKSQKVFISFSDLEGEWDIVELNGNKLLPEETKQRLTFDTAGHRLSGNAGCNRISGNITYDNTHKNNVKFQEVVSTRKACLDMRLEDEFLKALNKVARFDTNSRGKQIKTMVFYDASNRKLFVAQAHPKQ